MTLVRFLEMPRKTLLLTGSWPKHHYSAPYLIRRGIAMVNIALLMLSFVYTTVFHINNVVQFCESLCFLISIVNVLWKLIMLALNENKFLKLLDLLDTPTFTKGELLYPCIYLKFMEIVKPVWISYFILCNGCVICRVLLTVFGSDSLLFDFPHFNTGTLHYPFYLFQLFSICTVAYDNMAVDLLVVGVISITAVQLQVLNSKLRDTKQNVQSLPNYSLDNEEMLTIRYLKDCCIHYSNIEEYIACLLEIFSIIIFVQLGTSIVAICTSGIGLLSAKPDSIEAISLLFYSVTMFTELAMYCWFGNFVYVESLEITTSCYLSHWEEHGTAVRKTLFMLMERSKRPLTITAIRFFTLSFETFIIILKWSYSYFALLRNSMED